MDWFTSLKMPGENSRAASDNRSYMMHTNFGATQYAQQSMLTELGGKRFIVITICLPDSLVKNSSKAENEDTDPIASLVTALMACLERLEENDFVCFNMGNSQVKLFNDHQTFMENW